MKTVHITEQKKVENPTSEHETVDLSIDTAGLVHLMGVLTNLYSSPDLAVLREYVSNAIDSHTKAGGVDRPIELTIPVYQSNNHHSRFSNTITNMVVRDFGVGMSKEEIVNVYSRYGNSTKRDNNDEIGGFGLGAKSALAISDRFDVVSIKDGKRVEFYVEKNIQGVGVIHFVSETDTDELSGVEVTVPYTKIWEDTALYKFFVGVPSGTLRINGELLVNTLDNEDVYSKVAGIDDEVATGWYSKEADDNSTRPSVIVGGVVYTLDRGSYDTQAVQQLGRFNRRVYGNLPIGSVDLTPSREELIYSPKTISALDATINSLRDSIAAVVQSELNSITDQRAAFDFCYSIRSHFWDMENLKWRGKVVPSQFKPEGDVVVFVPAHQTAYRKVPAEIETVSRYGIDLNNTFYNNEVLVLLSNTGNAIEEAKTLRRRSRFVTAATGFEKFYILTDKKDYNDYWVKLSHHAKMKNVNDVLDTVKEHATAERKRLKAAGHVPKKRTVKPVAQIATFPKKKDGPVLIVERLFADDARLTPKDPTKVLYVKQNEHRNVYPSFYWESDEQEAVSVDRDTSGFWGIVEKDFSDHTVFVLASQRSMEKFKQEYPHAKDILSVVKAHANALFVPKRQVTHEKIVASIGYPDRANYTHLISLREVLEEKNLIQNVTNKKFLEITTKKAVDNENFVPPTAYEMALESWSDYLASKDPELIEIIKTGAAEISEKVKEFSFFARYGYNTMSENELRNVVNFINVNE